MGLTDKPHVIAQMEGAPQCIGIGNRSEGLGHAHVHVQLFFFAPELLMDQGRQQKTQPAKTKCSCVARSMRRT
jgi:hypothetical protein